MALRKGIRFAMGSGAWAGHRWPSIKVETCPWQRMSIMYSGKTSRPHLGKQRKWHVSNCLLKLAKGKTYTGWLGLQAKDPS